MKFKNADVYRDLSPKAQESYSGSDFYVTTNGETYRVELNKIVQFEGTLEEVNKWYENERDSWPEWDD